MLLKRGYQIAALDVRDVVAAGVPFGVGDRARAAGVGVKHLADDDGRRDAGRTGERDAEFGVALASGQRRRGAKHVYVPGRAERRREVDGRGVGGSLAEFRDGERAVVVGDPGVGVAVVDCQENDDRSS